MWCCLTSSLSVGAGETTPRLGSPGASATGSPRSRGSASRLLKDGHGQGQLGTGPLGCQGETLGGSPLWSTHGPTSGASGGLDRGLQASGGLGFFVEQQFSWRGCAWPDAPQAPWPSDIIGPRAKRHNQALTRALQSIIGKRQAVGARGSARALHRDRQARGGLPEWVTGSRD